MRTTPVTPATAAGNVAARVGTGGRDELVGDGPASTTLTPRTPFWSEIPRPTRSATLLRWVIPAQATVVAVPIAACLAQQQRLTVFMAAALGVASARRVQATEPLQSRILIGASVGAAILGARTATPGLTNLAQALALVVVFAIGRWPAQLTRAGAVIAVPLHGLGRLVVVMTYTVLGIPIVLAPWAFQRLTRWDPTWTPHRSGSRLVERDRGDSSAARTWSRDPSLRRPGPGRAIHRFALAVCVIVAVTGAFFTIRGIANRALDRPDLDSPALAASPWWPAVRNDQYETFETAQWSARLGPTARDTSVPGLHVSDGRRSTWRPPVGDGAEVRRVWMFGGSTMFGIGQRDDHTIASEFARAAWADGVAVEVSNFGFLADVHWMERERLINALESDTSAPDLVVFYDGFNDLNATGIVNADGLAAVAPFVGTLDAVGVQPRWSPLQWLDRALGGDPTTPPTTTVLDEGEVLERGVDQYIRSIEHTRRLLESRDLEGRYFLQPTLATRDGGRSIDGPTTADQQDAYRAFRLAAPPEVIDLSTVFDDSDQTIFFDSAHTNELGARLVGQQMWSDVRSDL